MQAKAKRHTRKKVKDTRITFIGIARSKVKIVDKVLENIKVKKTRPQKGIGKGKIEDNTTKKDGQKDNRRPQTKVSRQEDKDNSDR